MANETSWRAFLQSVILLAVGAVLGKGLDYWMTYVHVVSQIDGRLVAVAALENALEIDVAFVNSGNHDGAIVGADVVFLHANGYGTPAPKDWAISGSVPFVIEPGQIRLIHYSGRIDLDTMLHNAKITEQWAGRESHAWHRVHADVGLRVRALDFRGQVYEARWKVCSISRDQQGGGLGTDWGDKRLVVFTHEHLFKDTWWGFPAASQTPQPTLNPDLPTTVELTPSLN